MNFWTKAAGLILRNRYIVLLLVAAFTAFLVSQTKHIKFSYTEANLLPENHEANVQYNQFLDIFGEEGNLIILAVKDSTLFTPEKFNAWNQLTKQIDASDEIEFTVSIADVQELKADRKNRRFVLKPLLDKAPKKGTKWKDLSSNVMRLEDDGFLYYTNDLFITELKMFLYLMENAENEKK